MASEYSDRFDFHHCFQQFANCQCQCRLLFKNSPEKHIPKHLLVNLLNWTKAKRVTRWVPSTCGWKGKMEGKQRMEQRKMEGKIRECN